MTLHLVKLAINNIRSRRTRSWLTILGVLIGVTAVVSLLSIGTGVEQAVLQQFKDIGYDIIVITPNTGLGQASATMGGPGFAGQSATTSAAPPSGRTFSPDQIGTASVPTSPSSGPAATVTAAAVDTQALLKAVTGLVDAGNLGTRVASVEGPSASGFLRVTTPSLSFLAAFPSILGGFTIANGTTFTNTTENEVVIGARSARTLGIGIGDVITIDGSEFAVIGILASSRSVSAESSAATGRRRNGTARAGAGTVGGVGTGASLLARGMTNTDDSLFVLRERAVSLWISQAGSSFTIVRMATGAKVDQVMTSISAELTAQGVLATPVSVQQIAANIQGTLGMIETVLASIAAVALVVGGIGLMNTMYTSVLERTREIGILKAVGARDGQVMALFLVDSGLMGLIGGVLGLVLGGLLSFFGTRLLGPALGVGSFQPVFGTTLIVGVLVASFVIGALSVAWPAWRASRLNPVEALAAE